MKHFVELHGGQVSAASDGVGRGSVFTVSLPARTRRLPAARRRIAPAGACCSSRSEDAREMMRFALEFAGHEVTEARTAPAVAAVADTNDIAFVDIGLPGFNGYEVARQVRAMRGRAIVLWR